MRIIMVCLEDGITSCGFRKMSASVCRINPDTKAFYVSTQHYRSLRGAIFGTFGSSGDLEDNDVEAIAQQLASSADLIGYSSMTGYSALTRKIVKRVRELAPSVYQIWGGIHPIIHPDDAITADVDAICTGEGEFAFAEFFEAFKHGKDFLATQNFWFKHNGEVIKNGFRPLFTPAELEELPFPLYGENEWIYKTGRGFIPMGVDDYLDTNGLGYTALWSIGCPLHCSFCGNTKFISNHSNYRVPRHPSATYMVNEVKAAREKMPHISAVSFHDDSFMAIRLHDLEEFAEVWKREVDLPFAVYGVIPNYVNQDKFEVLTWAGMNRIRMGIQSGSEEILKFYRRPTPPKKIKAGAEIIGKFAPKYHIAPAYDIIVDNPVETKQDVVDTLELLYNMPRPFNLLTYSLKVIPNTQLEKQMLERGVDLDEIDANYSQIPPRMANLMLYLIVLFKPPRKMWEKMLAKVDASTVKQPMYPKTAVVLRGATIVKRAFQHIKVMDFTIIPGKMGYFFYKTGIVGFFHKHVNRKFPKPPKRSVGTPTRRGVIPIVEMNDEDVAKSTAAH